MLCNNCNIRSICKIFDTINTPGIEVEMKSCAFNSSSAENIKPFIEGQSTQAQESLPQVQQEQRKSRAYQDITELSNKLKEEKEAKKRAELKKNQPKVNIIEVEESEEKECSSCNTKTTTFFNCPICEKEICLACAMLSISDTGQVTNMCEECWATDAEKKHK